MPIEKSNHTISRPLSQLAGGAKHSPLPEPAALDDLRAKIRQIEQSQTPFPKNGADLVSPTCTTSPDHPEPSPHAKEQKAAKGHCNKGRCNKAHWSFDIPEIDQALRQNQLNPAALHEIKPATYQDSHAALGFALALAGRRLIATPAAPLLWCLPPVMSGEFGIPYGPGLRHLIPKPENCLITEPGTESDFLWAMEEGLNASANADTSVGTTATDTRVFALVLGMVPKPSSQPRPDA